MEKRYRHGLESIAEAWVVPDYPLALSDAIYPALMTLPAVSTGFGWGKRQRFPGSA